MPLSFHPGPGAIVICDYSTGFQPPEMVKVRPVVVISPRRRSSQLVWVKCDMVATVGLKRLDRVKVHNRQGPPSCSGAQ